MLLALDVEFEPGLAARQIAATVDSLEAEIRERYPRIKRIYIEARVL